MRKYICITYHMAKLDGETAETCIDLPMDEKIADDILRAQRDSRYVKDAAWPIASILQNLAKLQGYDSSAFCMAEKSNLSGQVLRADAQGEPGTARAEREQLAREEPNPAARPRPRW